LHQYKKTKYFEVGNQFNALFPLTFALYPHSTDKLHIRCKISVLAVGGISTRHLKVPSRGDQLQINDA
ncbi:MAG: hypothetical protein WBM86_31870, partial [Waterburya sp.]